MLKKLFAFLMLVSLSFTTSACMPFSFDVKVNKGSNTEDFDDGFEEDEDEEVNNGVNKNKNKNTNANKDKTTDGDNDADADEGKDDEEDVDASGGANDRSATGAENKADGYVATIKGHDVYIRDDGVLVVEKCELYLGNVTAKDAAVTSGDVITVGDWRIVITNNNLNANNMRTGGTVNLGFGRK